MERDRGVPGARPEHAGAAGRGERVPPRDAALQPAAQPQQKTAGAAAGAGGRVLLALAQLAARRLLRVSSSKLKTHHFKNS